MERLYAGGGVVANLDASHNPVESYSAGRSNSRNGGLLEPNVVVRYKLAANDSGNANALVVWVATEVSAGSVNVAYTGPLVNFRVLGRI